MSLGSPLPSLSGLAPRVAYAWCSVWLPHQGAGTTRPDALAGVSALDRSAGPFDQLNLARSVVSPHRRVVVRLGDRLGLG